MTKFTPYWWEGQPRFENNTELPQSADVVIVGAGYTGLSAALTLANNGKKVIVLDAEDIGFGASTRNGGMLGSGHKVSNDHAQQKYGSEVASNLHKEANASLAYTTNLIKENQIDCDLQICGRRHQNISGRNEILCHSRFLYLLARHFLAVAWAFSIC